MTAQEFYEKHKGEYFIHKNQKVRVVGYHSYSFDALIVSISKGNGMGFVTAQEFLNRELVSDKDLFRYAFIDELKYIVEKINLCELLKGYEGNKFYSIILGDCTIEKVSKDNIRIKSATTNRTISVDSEGNHYSDESGECTLFPSRENRNWRTFKRKKILPENSVVMASVGEKFKLRFYKACDECYSFGMNKADAKMTSSFKWIVPIEDYDMDASFEENIKKSII